MTENKADPLREALTGNDPEMPDPIRPIGWLKSMIHEANRRGPAIDCDDPSAYWEMVSEVELLWTKASAALATTPQPPAPDHLPLPFESAGMRGARKQAERDHASMFPQPAAPLEGHAPFSFSYKNHRGEISMRTASPIGVRFGSTEWHQKPQWLMRAFDHDKNAEREFAMADMSQPAAPLGGREAIDTALRAYFQSRFAPVQLSSDGVERVYCNGFPLNGLIDAILAIPQAIESECCREDSAAWEPCPPFAELQDENGLLRAALAVPVTVDEIEQMIAIEFGHSKITRHAAERVFNFLSARCDVRILKALKGAIPQERGVDRAVRCTCGIMCQDLGKDAGCRYLKPEREALRKLVDVVYQHATESTTFPATVTADLLIDRAFGIGAIAADSGVERLLQAILAEYEQTIDAAEKDTALSDTGRQRVIECCLDARGAVKVFAARLLAQPPTANVVAGTDRAAIIEECAKVVDLWIKDFGSIQTKHLNARSYAVDAVADVAEAIRALAGKETDQ